MTLADYGFSPEPFSTLFILIVLLLGVVFVIGLIIYALKAVAYYDMSKTLQIKSEWFGFIPFLRDISCGNIAEGKQKSRYGVTLIALSIVYTVFSLIYVCILGTVLINMIFEADSAMLKGLSELPKEYMESAFKTLIVPSVLMMVSGVAYKVMRIIGEFRIYRKFAPSSAVAFLILGIIIPVLTPFFMFSIRKNLPAEEKSETATFDFG